MQVINPEIFYNYLITNEGFNNDLSLYAKNTYLDATGHLCNYFNFDISNQSGEWLENQMNTMETENDDDETIFGNFRYLSTVVSEEAMFPMYSELFSLQLICFEKQRDAIIKFFDNFCTEFNNHQTDMDLENDEGENELYDILVQLGELSTPEYGEKQDIGGSERFILDVSFSITVSSGIITAKKIRLYDVDSDGASEIPYVELTIERANELNVDNRASTEKKYDVNKSDFTITLSALYTQNPFSNKVMDYTFDSNNAGNSVSIHYTDTSSGIDESKSTEEFTVYKREKTFECCFNSVSVKYSYGQPVSYSVSLKPIINIE